MQQHMIVCFLSNISAKYYKNPSMLSRVIAKNVGDVFLRHSVYLQNGVQKPLSGQNICTIYLVHIRARNNARNEILNGSYQQLISTSDSSYDHEASCTPGTHSAPYIFGPQQRVSQGPRNGQNLNAVKSRIVDGDHIEHG